MLPLLLDQVRILGMATFLGCLGEVIYLVGLFAQLNK